VRLHLVVPALNSRLRHWVSDIDRAVSAARRRAEDARAVLKAHGLAVSVEVGDSIPLLAIDDALALFDADEIVISTLPPSRSHWLEHRLVELARDRFDVPVRHLIVSDDGMLAA
jgi:GABA permease